MASLRFYILLGLFALILTSCSSNKTVTIEYEKHPQIDFAVSELETELSKKGYSVNDKSDFTIKLHLDNSISDAQAYTISSKQKQITISASDINGLMYGGLELSELISIGTPLDNIKTISEKPHIEKRGIKFNIPLDIRTSSFDDSGDAAQNNIEEMWNFEFWEAFFDNMARNRYNMISYWNAHPFSSMVKLDDYPDVALEDVCGTNIKPQENSSAWLMPELPSIKAIENIKVIKKMSIDEKIAFWQKVMEHAHNRGIDIYYITWNICLNGAALPGTQDQVGDTPGKYGITNVHTNETSIDYLRKSVKQFLLNYPHVTGIGVTAGENMRYPMTDDDKEHWLWETYGEGIMDAKALQPDRTVNFIHRFWWTDMNLILKYWGDYPDPFDMSFKYAKAHIYSAVNPPFHKPLLDWMAPHKLKSWWNLRNDDIFIHRWGNPEFVSQFIKNLPINQTSGYHMGSDGYVWGKEFISKNAELSGQLEIDKHWFKFMLWGRLGYNPEIKNERFINILETKYPETNSAKLFEAWKTASEIIPQVTRAHWGDWDYQWQPEACMGSGHVLQDINFFRTAPTMKDSGILNPVDYVKAKTSNTLNNDMTPLEVADNLESDAKKAIKLSDELINDENSTELSETLLDIKSMSFLGQYYAHKFRAAVALELFKSTGELGNKEQAISHLEQAVISWEQYTNINVDRYKAQNFSRLATFDWNEQLKLIKADVEIAKKALTYKEEATMN